MIRGGIPLYVQYARLRPAELARLRELVGPDPDAAFDYVDELAEWADGRPLDEQRGLLLDLTGEPALGGSPLPSDWGQGPPVVLTPTEVVVAAAALDEGELAVFLTAAAEAGDAVVSWRS
jgi:hypothetical protein